MRRFALVGIGLAGLWWWLGGDSSAPATLQAAVLADGFAAVAGDRVVEVDRGGHRRHEMTLALDRDFRLVGTRGGTAIGWQDGTKVKLAILDDDGGYGDASTWGKKVVRLCSGAASNEQRFGVGWLESDGRVWFVHGPLERRVDAHELQPAAKVSWCGIASAEANVALVWREGKRTFMNFCTQRQCSGVVMRVPIDDTDDVGFGCLRDSCLFASHRTDLVWVDDDGRTKRTRLADASRGQPVRIVGAGDRAFAISYLAGDGRSTIRRITKDGTFTHVWHFATERPPAIAWAAGTLLAAFDSGETLVLELAR